MATVEISNEWEVKLGWMVDETRRAQGEPSLIRIDRNEAEEIIREMRVNFPRPGTALEVKYQSNDEYLKYSPVMRSSQDISILQTVALLDALENREFCLTFRGIDIEVMSSGWLNPGLSSSGK